MTSLKNLVAVTSGSCRRLPRRGPAGRERSADGEGWRRDLRPRNQAADVAARWPSRRFRYSQEARIVHAMGIGDALTVTMSSKTLADASPCAEQVAGRLPREA
jgi:hypothetical protein